jgi:hypothetical protein
MDPDIRSLSAQQIISLNQSVLLNIFADLMEDPSTPYTLSRPTHPPQFVGPNQEVQTITITPTNDETHEFYVDKMTTVIPGSDWKDDSPCYRIFAADCGTWSEVVKGMLPPALLQPDEAQEINAAISILGPALLIQAGPEVKKIFERVTRELANLEQG